MTDAGELSKSAKRRLAQKARAEKEAAAGSSAQAAAAVQAPFLPANLQAKVAKEAPAPKSKAGAKATAAKEPAPKAQPKAKADATKKAEAPKAAAQRQSKNSTPQPQAAPVVQQEAPVAAPKATPKSKAGAKGKAQPKAQQKPVAQKPVAEAPKPARKKTEEEGLINCIIDDGSGPAWEVSDRTSKRNEKRNQKLQEAARATTSKDEDNFETVPRKQRQEKREPREPRDVQPRGVKQSVLEDIDRILNMKSPEVEKPPKEEEEDDGKVSTTVVVDTKKLGAIKANLKAVQYKTWTKIDSRGPSFTISGEQEWVDKAEVAIKELEQKGYCAIVYDDFAESFIQVPSRQIPELIGSQGSTIKKIKEKTGCEIIIPQFSREQGPVKVKVDIAGEAKEVEITKTIIQNIMEFHHDPTISPDEVHETMDIEASKNGLLVGNRGSELRHMQNSYKVSIYIPREDTLCQQVVIVGEAEKVSRAKAHIERLIQNGGAQARRSDPRDPMGDDE